MKKGLFLVVLVVSIVVSTGQTSPMWRGVKNWWYGKQDDDLFSHVSQEHTQKLNEKMAAWQSSKKLDEDKQSSKEAQKMVDEMVNPDDKALAYAHKSSKETSGLLGELEQGIESLEQDVGLNSKHQTKEVFNGVTAAQLDYVGEHDEHKQDDVLNRLALANKLNNKIRIHYNPKKPGSRHGGKLIPLDQKRAEALDKEGKFNNGNVLSSEALPKVLSANSVPEHVASKVENKQKADHQKKAQAVSGQKQKDVVASKPKGAAKATGAKKVTPKGQKAHTPTKKKR